MTRTAKIVPLAFEDFAPKSPSAQPAAMEVMQAPPPPERFTQDEIDAAFAEGRAAGRRESEGAAAAQSAIEISQLADLLVKEQALRDAALDERAAALRAQLRAFLDFFCRRLAADRAAPLALSLVERLLTASADRAPATLFVSDKTFAGFGESLRAELADRDAAFIAIGADGSLEPGECRLQWRGGAASWSHETVTAGIDRILDAAAAETPENRP